MSILAPFGCGSKEVEADACTCIVLALVLLLIVACVLIPVLLMVDASETPADNATPTSSASFLPRSSINNGIPRPFCSVSHAIIFFVWWS